MTRAIIAACVLMLTASAMAGELIIEPPLVDGKAAADYRIWISTSRTDPPPASPWTAPKTIDGPATITGDEDIRITVRIATEPQPPTATAPAEGLERAIYELQRVTGARK